MMDQYYIRLRRKHEQYITCSANMETTFTQYIILITLPDSGHSIFFCVPQDDA